MRTRIAAVTCAAILFAVLPLLTGCNDDDCPTCGGGTVTATMANIWPHADGNAWTYTGTYTEYLMPDGIVAVDSVAVPLPSMEALHAALQAPFPGETVDGTALACRLTLHGTIDVGTGSPVQRLLQQIFVPQGPIKVLPPAGPEELPDRLLLAVARARPDLRAAILDRLPAAAAKQLDAIDGPAFLGGLGEGLAVTDSGYVAWIGGDFAEGRPYLLDSLEVGTEFSQQLLPALTDDLWLHARIWNRGPLSVGGRSFTDVVECLYVVDMGVMQVIDEMGTVLGTYRPYYVGSTFYAPEVGPVAVRERQLVAPQVDWAPGYPGALEYVLDLAGATTAE